ncbi:MAG: magnesium transporter [Planctomycetaceae bacterium]|nr:magnesium transporter [Planctomycetaceae bacterium]
MINSLLLPDLRQMLEEDDGPALKEFCEALHPGVAAEVLGDLNTDATWQVLTHCGPETQAEIFGFLPLPYQVQLVKSIDGPQLTRLIEEMPADDRVDLLERMEPDAVDALLPLLAHAERRDIRKLLSYPEYSAGSIMTTEYASLPAEITVKEALERVRKQAPSRETIYYVYVTDEERHLRGFVSLRDMILAKPDTKLEQLMETDVISVRVDDDQEHVALEIAKYDFIAIPVVDNQNRLVGIVTHDDAADVLVEEATEDQQRQGAVAPLEDSYLDTSLLTLAWKRGIWLVILLGAAFLTAYVISFFVSEGGGVTWMAMFLPLVLASGGNAGSQSATLIIQALALRETAQGDARRICLREMMMGSLLGAGLACLAILTATVLVEFYWQAMVVGSTVFLVVILGTVVGAMLPIGFKSLGVDPALMSNPLIAALVDVLGVILYYNIARIAEAAVT